MEIHREELEAKGHPTHPDGLKTASEDLYGKEAVDGVLDVEWRRCIAETAAPILAAEEARAEAEEYYRQLLAEKERAAKSQVLPSDTGGNTTKMA